MFKMPGGLTIGMILLLEAVMMTAPTSGFPTDQPTTTKGLVSFNPPNPASWDAIDDTVMGGASKSRMSVTRDATGVFSGHLSLENGGGFTSVRTHLPEVDLSEYSGLEIKVRGDGRTYQLRLRTNRGFDGVAYRARFNTEDASWAVVRIPFSAFEATFRGRRVGDAPSLDSSRIMQLGLLLSDTQEGVFRIELEWIRAYR